MYYNSNWNFHAQHNKSPCPSNLTIEWVAQQFASDLLVCDGGCGHLLHGLQGPGGTTAALLPCSPARSQYTQGHAHHNHAYSGTHCEWLQILSKGEDGIFGGRGGGGGMRERGVCA